MRTGLGKIGNYNPLRPDPQAVSQASKPVRHLISSALKDLHPDIVGNDFLIQSGLPILQRGRGVALGADPLEHIVNRVSRPTGGLLGAVAGAHAAGPLGGLLGLLAPDLMTGPGALLKSARLFDMAPQLSRLTQAGLLGAVNGSQDQQ